VQPALESPGQALDMGTRAAMEARFGHDFSQVRVHTDGTAAAAAKELQSLAFTHGQDIVFAAGQYSPRTPVGMRLLAHELAHTVQQRGAPRTVQGFTEVSRPGAPLEREAESAASRVAEGGALAPAALSDAAAWLAHYETFWTAQLDALGRYLYHEEETPPCPPLRNAPKKAPSSGSRASTPSRARRSGGPGPTRKP